jgi:HemY protein
MSKIVSFILLILAIGFGFAWLAERPGLLSVEWQGQLIEMSLLVAASAIAVIVGAVMLVWWLISTIWASPALARRYLRTRKRDRGYQALSTGLIAAGAGNALLARKMTARTQGLLRADQEPLILLLEAQTDIIEGKFDDAHRKFETMSRDPETRELGLRGLYIEARRQGAYEAASQYAEQAAVNAPYLPWAAKASLENKCRRGEWDQAIMLLDQQRAARVLEKSEVERLKSILLTAKANEILESDPALAKATAQNALKYAKDLVPAALIVAKAYMREDNVRKAAKILESHWKDHPHPQLAELYVRARSGDSAVDRLQRASKLESLKPNNVDALIAVSEAALGAKDFKLAREKAEAAAKITPRKSIYLLLADIEQEETGDQGRVRHWLSQAVKAPADPAWVAGDIVSDQWLPISPVTGQLDAFEWKTPYEGIAGQIEDVSIDKAVEQLPDVAQPIIEERIVEVPVVIEQKPTLVTKAVAEPTKPTVATAPTPAPKAISPQPSVISAPKETKMVKEADDIVPFFGGAPDDPGVKKKVDDQAATSLPAKDASSAPRGDKQAVPSHITAEKDEDLVPFYGRPPDDPGVKQTKAEYAEKPRLKLF